MPQRKAIWTQVEGANVSAKKPRKRIRKVSKRQSKRLRDYAKVRDEYLRKYKQCQVCCLRKSVEVHHTRGRGRFLCDTSTFVPVCRPCHNRIHNEPAWATRQGWMLPRT